MTASHDVAWRGDPADIVAEFDPAVAARTFVDWIATMTPSWHLDALCREYPGGWWFPQRGEPTDPARQICDRCVVSDECLAEALNMSINADIGIRAGLSARQRRKLRTDRTRSTPELIVRRTGSADSLTVGGSPVHPAHTRLSDSENPSINSPPTQQGDTP